MLLNLEIECSQHKLWPLKLSYKNMPLDLLMLHINYDHLPSPWGSSLISDTDKVSSSGVARSFERVIVTLAVGLVWDTS